MFTLTFADDTTVVTTDVTTHNPTTDVTTGLSVVITPFEPGIHNLLA